MNSGRLQISEELLTAFLARLGTLSKTVDLPLLGPRKLSIRPALLRLDRDRLELPVFRSDEEEPSPREYFRISLTGFRLQNGLLCLTPSVEGHRLLSVSVNVLFRLLHSFLGKKLMSAAGMDAGTLFRGKGRELQIDLRSLLESLDLSDIQIEEFHIDGGLDLRISLRSIPPFP